MKKAYNNIYAARGIGILLVLIGHAVSPDSYLGMTIYSFHMPLFFLLSGIFAGTYEKYKFSDFFKKQTKHVMFPYLIMLGFGIIVNLCVPQWRTKLTGENFLETFLHCNPYYWKTTAALWFLVALFWTQLIFYFYHKYILSKNDKLVITFLVAFGFYAAIYAFVLEQKLGFTYLFQFKSTLMALQYYTIGYLMRNEIKSFSMDKSHKLNWIIMLICILLTFGYAARWNGNVNLGGNWYNDSFKYIIYSMTGCVGTIAIGKILEKSKVLVFLGKESMTLYLTHLFFLHMYTYIMKQCFGITISENLDLNNIIRIIVMIVLSSLTALIVVKIKSKKQMKTANEKG